MAHDGNGYAGSLGSGQHEFHGCRGAGCRCGTIQAQVTFFVDIYIDFLIIIKKTVVLITGICQLILIKQAKAAIVEGHLECVAGGKIQFTGYTGIIVIFSTVARPEQVGMRTGSRFPRTISFAIQSQILTILISDGQSGFTGGITLGNGPGIQLVTGDKEAFGQSQLIDIGSVAAGGQCIIGIAVLANDGVGIAALQIIQLGDELGCVHHGDQFRIGSSHDLAVAEGGGAVNIEEVCIGQIFRFNGELLLGLPGNIGIGPAAIFQVCGHDTILDAADFFEGDLIVGTCNVTFRVGFLLLLEGLDAALIAVGYLILALGDGLIDGAQIETLDGQDVERCIAVIVHGHGVVAGIGGNDSVAACSAVEVDSAIIADVSPAFVAVELDRNCGTTEFILDIARGIVRAGLGHDPMVLTGQRADGDGLADGNVSAFSSMGSGLEDNGEAACVGITLGAVLGQHELEHVLGIVEVEQILALVIGIEIAHADGGVPDLLLAQLAVDQNEVTQGQGLIMLVSLGVDHQRTAGGKDSGVGHDLFAFGVGGDGEVISIGVLNIGGDFADGADGLAGVVLQGSFLTVIVSCGIDQAGVARVQSVAVETLGDNGILILCVAGDGEGVGGIVLDDLFQLTFAEFDRGAGGQIIGLVCLGFVSSFAGGVHQRQDAHNPDDQDSADDHDKGKGVAFFIPARRSILWLAPEQIQYIHIQSSISLALGICSRNEHTQAFSMWIITCNGKKSQ